MEKKSDLHFSYPPNLRTLDLATLVSMYRERGMPQKAKPGEYFGCALNKKVIKNGKWWFGRYYSQEAWNVLLTKNCEGYPLTEVELNILGLVLNADQEPRRRDFVEKHSGALPKMGYMIVNDLREYGFLSINDQDRLMITPRGEKALQGIAKRIYEKKFRPEMLQVNQPRQAQPVERARKKSDNEQANLF